MAKKNWWVRLVNSLFTCESKQKAEKRKAKGWRWIFDRFRFKQLPTSTGQKSLSEAREEQRKHAVTVAKATAAAAEAAVVAAQAAAEVVRLTNLSRSSLRRQERQIQTMAAIKIQTAFRGYLAKKALRALKGVVRIQAIARGRAVRRRVRTTMKNLLSVQHQSQLFHATKVLSSIDTGQIGERNHFLIPTNEIERSKLECKSQRQWTDSVFSKEKIESIYMKKQDAVMRRERMKQYSFSHRERQYSEMQEEMMPLRNSERHSSCHRKQWQEEDNIYSKPNPDNIALNCHSNTKNREFSGGYLRIRPRNLAKEDLMEEVSSPFSHPRRSFCQMRLKSGDEYDYQLSSPSIFPTYMATTESAKAKMRSMSTPRQRIGYFDTCFEHGSPCKNNRLYCSWSTFNGDRSLTSSCSTIAKASGSQSKSLTMEVLRQD